MHPKKHGSLGRCAAAAVVAVLAIVSPPPSEGQVQAEYRPLTWKTAGARAMALGDAVGSDAFDIGSMYQNPAALSFLRAADVEVDQRSDESNKVFIDNVAARIFVNRLQALGLGVGVEHCGKFTKNTPLNFTQVDVDAGYAIKLPTEAEDLSVGVLAEVRYGRDDSLSRTAAQMSFGLFYAPSAGPSYSIVYRGLGKTIGYAAMPGSGGVVTRGQIGDSPRSLEIGSTMSFPETGRPQYITISVAGERDLLSKVFRVKGGIETSILNTLSLRAGYVKSEFPQLRLGAGISLGRFSLEYANMPWEQPGRLNEFTLKYAFSTNRE